MKERTLALAGVFQATELVRQAANHGTWSGYAASSSLHSLFQLEAESTAEIYGGTARMKLGVETMLAVLQGDNRYTESLRYAVGLLQIEKKFRKSSKFQATVGNRLEDISAEGAELEQHEREDLQAHEISALYTDTVSKLTPRIVVSGRPQYLKNERTVDWVRTLLMAGLRSATLWNQLGGGRFELMFGRKKIIREAESLLMS
ncbi:MAG: high frequency lysogenization protein HflD [Xanthomonadales bacterium]|jgi:high frequency lysogenization protein|nr:high frequency lysogenization protein HflD [Xanthomonadales bacterium]MDH3924939.1 high frequency lysogenization protein HflD [Xanthomonadales bacterium]MDH3941658.1 high frequency lysogenization protein HflD [Xanthomonadales bacterium]MDH4000097.1 high frequency lysogenization protein HflD [Xanthomonadales bacterium]